MEKQRQTTVILAEFAQSIKDRLAPVFGLKNILSAGLVLFDEQSDSEQKRIIREVNSSPEKEAVIAEVTRLVGGLSNDEKLLIIRELKEKYKEKGDTVKGAEVDVAKKAQGQVSKAVHVIREMSPDGALSIEFLSDEDRRAIGELAKLVRRETKKSNKSKEA